MFGFNELSTPVKAIIALGLVLLLVLIAGLLLRRIAGGKLKLPGQGNRTRQPRLGVVDIFEMDRQRQLVLLRRDNVEHLVMIGGPNDLVIEASIVRAAARAQVPAVGEAPEKAAPAAVIRAAVPESAEPVDDPQPIRRPNIVAAPPQAPEPAAAVPQAAAAETRTSQATTSAPVLGAIAAGAATLAATTGLAKPAASDPQPKIPAPAPSPEPVVAPPKTRAEDNIAASFEAEMARMTAPPAAKPILEPIAPTPAAKASPGELEDMTRQLQEALKRPFSGVKPAAAQPMVPAERSPTLESAATVAATPAKIAASPEPSVALPEPVMQPAAPEKIEAEQDLKSLAALDFDLEREMASALAPVAPPPPATTRSEPDNDAGPAKLAQPEPLAKPVVATVKNAPPAPEPAALQTTPEPVARKPVVEPVVEPVKTPPGEAPRPQPKAEKSKPAEAKSADAPASTAPAGTPQTDPFSVDAIEAEFARLLNRSAPPKG